MGKFLLSLEEAYLSLRQFELFAEKSRKRGLTLEKMDSLALRVLDIKIQRLMIARIRVESPGLWEFLGSLNPLEVIRKALNDRHERKKDSKYRNLMEEQRLGLENMILKTEVLQKQIDLLRNAGFAEEEIQTVVRNFVTEPLNKLQQNSEVSTAVFIERE